MISIGFAKLSSINQKEEQKIRDDNAGRQGRADYIEYNMRGKKSNGKSKSRDRGVSNDNSDKNKEQKKKKQNAEEEGAILLPSTPTQTVPAPTINNHHDNNNNEGGVVYNATMPGPPGVEQAPASERFPLMYYDMAGRFIPLEIVFVLVDSLKSFTRLVGLYWFDEDGSGPFERFFKIDNTPTTRFLPSSRTMLFSLLGFCFSLFALTLTEDEFFNGARIKTDVNEPHNHMAALNQDEQVYISFKNVGCDIASLGRALSNITAEAKPGKVTAIMGASGSGKTTLALTLLGRSRFTCTSSGGTVSLNGFGGSSLDMFLDRVGFVPQSDVLYPEMTVQETLEFSAKWRLPRYYTNEERMHLVNDTLRTLNLYHLRDATVGGTHKLRGLSGGERRRVSIGMEMVARPSVIVLDEPTSGLDGAAAYKLLKTLHGISRTRNVSVVAVLHQPSERMFDLMDDLILLRGGRMVYSGPKDSVFPYLNSVLPRKTKKRNDVETLLDLVSGFDEDQDAEEIGVFDKLPQLFLESSFFKDQLEAIEKRELEYSHRSANERTVPDTSCTNLSNFRRVLCNIRRGLLQRLFPFFNWLLPSFVKEPPALLRDAPFPVRPKPGLVYQTVLWVDLKTKLEFRRTFLTECFIMCTLAFTVAYVNVFMKVWSKRPTAFFYISISLGMVGMLGAAVEQDIGPIRRAISSGMGAGGYYMASFLITSLKLMIQCTLFSVTYFGTSYLMAQPRWNETPVFCCSPFSFKVFAEFTYLTYLNTMVARSMGNLLSVLVDHDEMKSYILCTGTLISVHLFSLFAPTYHQLDARGVVLWWGRIDLTWLFKLFGTFSYVRYFLEAMFLWVPATEGDKVGRDFMIKFHSYDEKNASACAITLNGYFLGVEVIRILIFSFRNATDFSSTNDYPAFIIFFLKILVLHAFLLVIATVVNEWAMLKKVWQMSVHEAFEKREKEINQMKI